jgi:4-diphosphocytidyl-2-C-methyl-D-erythritol kinase
MFGLGLPVEQLLKYALLLGSDCPFFIINKPCFASSRGDILEPIELELSKYKVAIINPGIHIDTKWAFSKITPAKSVVSIKNIITQPIAMWKEGLINDFEIPVFEFYPEIKKIKEDLYNSGAVYASLSGSGSTVFGVFEKHLATDNLKNSNYFYKVIDLNF